MQGTEVNDTFTSVMIDAIARIWMRSTITLIDVRFQKIELDHPLERYKMPSSMLIYVYGGQTQIQLNENILEIERFGLIHGGKGTILTISPKEGRVKVFKVLYKAETSIYFKRSLQQLLEKVNPFRQQFGYTPSNPIIFLELFQQMLDSWSRDQQIDYLHAKSTLYQLIHSMYRDLEREKVRFLAPNPALLAKQYLDEHYREPIMIQSIASMFDISGGQLTRLFKKEEGMSLQQYLVQKRLTAASYYLTNTEATIKEIVAGCGFVAEKNLFRLFKKHYNMTPTDYRKKNVLSMHNNGIDNDYQLLYNEKGLDHLAQNHRDGEFIMFGKKRSKEIILAAAISLMMMLSACSSGATVNNGGTATQTPAKTENQVTEQQIEQPSATTKTITTVRGEVEVPQNPQRVVVLNYGFGDILALGVTPVAVNNYWAIAGSSVEELLKDVPRATEIEEIMSMDPDLIITTYEKDEDYAKLAKIAPTVSLGGVKDTIDKTPAERLHFLGEVLSVDQQKIDEVLNNYNEHVEQAKKKLEAAGLADAKVTIISDSLKEITLIASTYKGAHALYNELGVQRAEKVEELHKTNEWYGILSLEVLPEYIEDYLIIYGSEARSSFEGNAVYEGIEAVKRGRVIMMNEYLSNFDDVLSAQKQVDFLVDALLALP